MKTVHFLSILSQACCTLNQSIRFEKTVQFLIHKLWTIFWQNWWPSRPDGQLDHFRNVHFEPPTSTRPHLVCYNKLYDMCSLIQQTQCGKYIHFWIQRPFLTMTAHFSHFLDQPGLTKSKWLQLCWWHHVDDNFRISNIRHQHRCSQSKFVITNDSLEFYSDFHRRGFDAQTFKEKSNKFLSNVWDEFTNFHLDLKNGRL